MLSISLIGMSVNYITEGNFKLKRKNFLENQKTLVGVLFLFFIELIWLIFTNDLSNGLNSLRIKLPLLVLPLVLGTSEPLKPKEWKSLLIVFLTSLCLGVLVSFLVKYDFISPKRTPDQTEIYLFLCLILDLRFYYHLDFFFSDIYLLAKN